jgi:hypothetical protein
MIIKSATRLVFAAGCLTAIATLPAAHAQMGGGPAPGTYGYGPPPGAYGYGPPPGAYGYAPPPGAYGYGSPPGAYAPQSQHVAPPPSAGTAGAQVITNGPQTNPGDVSRSWSAQRNVMESESYESCSKETRHSAKRVCARNAARLPIRNFIGSASTALLSN